MITALYYPYTSIRNRGLVKTALLLWDSIECIVPRPDWQIEKPSKEKSYNEALNWSPDRMVKEEKNRQDVKEIERQFMADMRDDLLSLKHELNLTSLDPLFSKEMTLTAMVVSGAFIGPISGLTNLAATLQGIGIVPLVKKRIKHRKERRKTLLKHKISWLYLTQERTISFR